MSPPAPLAQHIILAYADLHNFAYAVRSYWTGWDMRLRGIVRQFDNSSYSVVAYNFADYATRLPMDNDHHIGVKYNSLYYLDSLE